LIGQQTLQRYRSSLYRICQIAEKIKQKAQVITIRNPSALAEEALSILNKDVTFHLQSGEFLLERNEHFNLTQ